MSAEGVPHLLPGPEVELIAVKLEALRVAQVRARADAEQDLVVLRVRLVHIVGVLGGEIARRAAVAIVELHHQAVGFALYVDGVRLDLQPEALAECLVEQVGVAQRVPFAALVPRVVDRARQAAGGDVEAGAVLYQGREVDARLVVETINEAHRAELVEVL